MEVDIRVDFDPDGGHAFVVLMVGVIVVEMSVIVLMFVVVMGLMFFVAVRDDPDRNGAVDEKMILPPGR